MLQKSLFKNIQNRCFESEKSLEQKMVEIIIVKHDESLLTMFLNRWLIFVTQSLLANMENH